ncbi:MAG: hypothetical protein MUE50_25605, partial [Pirellulaceae bacterium]|nr:hypothetical protein [Pirellulaceae bacterium]
EHVTFFECAPRTSCVLPAVVRGWGKLCDAAALPGEGERGGMVRADGLAACWFQKPDVEWLLCGGGQAGQYH